MQKGLCSVPGKKEVLSTFAKLSQTAGFADATEAIKAAVAHDARDTYSIVAFARLNSPVLEMGPVALSPEVPVLPPYSPCIGDYDQLFLKGGGNVETTDC